MIGRLRQYLMISNPLFVQDFFEEGEMIDVVCILTNDQLDNIPEITYDSLNDELKNNNTYCTICMEEFIRNRDKNLRLLTCNHLYCSECISPWLLHYKHTCPICRNASEEYTYGNL